VEVPTDLSILRRRWIRSHRTVLLPFASRRRGTPFGVSESVVVRRAFGRFGSRRGGRARMRRENRERLPGGRHVPRAASRSGGTPILSYSAWAAADSQLIFRRYARSKASACSRRSESLLSFFHRNPAIRLPYCPLLSHWSNTSIAKINANVFSNSREAASVAVRRSFGQGQRQMRVGSQPERQRRKARHRRAGSSRAEQISRRGPGRLHDGREAEM